LARIDQLKSKPLVAWGPEVPIRRGETAGFSVRAHVPAKKSEDAPSALLVWDDYDKSSARSQVRGLGFSPVSMKAEGSEVAISPADEDATTPSLVARPGGYWAVWLAYGELAPANKKKGLVQEPPRALRAQKLDAQGKPLDEPLTVTPPGHQVLVYEAAGNSDGNLVIAYRATSSGRLEGASPVNVKVVGADGSTSASTFANENLGLGAPLLLEDAQGGSLWLSARGYESDVLLGELQDSGDGGNFDVEGGLTEKIPLARRGDDLLVMRPAGIDLKLSVVSC
jgi:hypothetical protein